MGYFPDEHGGLVGDLKITGFTSGMRELEEIKVIEGVSLTYCRENTTVESVIEDYDIVYVQFFPKNSESKVLEEKYKRSDFD